MSSRFKGKLCLHLRAKELTIFRYAIFGSWRRGALGVGWGSGPLGAATRCPRRRRPFHFFFATWPFLAIRNVRVLPDTTTDDGRTDGRTKPVSPQTPSFEQKIAKILSPNFFLAILKMHYLLVVLGRCPFPPSHGEKRPK